VIARLSCATRCPSPIPQTFPRALWNLDIDATCVTELDSSSVVKWSRHVVLRAPGAALASVAEAKALAASLLAHPNAAQLLVWKGHGQGERCQVSFVDSAVYTKCVFLTFFTNFLWFCTCGETLAVQEPRVSDAVEQQVRQGGQLCAERALRGACCVCDA